jgi:hypothetical protein
MLIKKSLLTIFLGENAKMTMGTKHFFRLCGCKLTARGEIDTTHFLL